MKKSLLFMLCLFFVFSMSACAQKKKFFSDRSFYYWKTVFELDGQDREILEKLKVSRIFLRFFDVVYSNKTNSVVSEKQVVFSSKYTGLNVVPVVFMTPYSIAGTKMKDLDVLADRVLKLTERICVENGVEIKGFQIDHDWVPSTKVKYFKFLELFDKQLKKKYPEASFSVTIRLHQVKYFDKTGIPPADEYFLMVYNMVDVKSFTSGPTTLNLKELKKYLKPGVGYPEELNVILPVFPSVYIYEGSRITGMLSDINDVVLNDKKYFSNKNSGVYLCKKNYSYRGHNFKVGQTVKVENITLDELEKALGVISKSIHMGNTVSLFHFDKKFLGRVTNEKINRLNSVFNY